MSGSVHTLPAVLAMATVNYLQLGIVLYRAHDNDDHAVRNRALRFWPEMKMSSGTSGSGP